MRSRLVSERTAVINEIRGLLLERGIIVRQILRFLRQSLPDFLAKRTDVLSVRMVRIVADLAQRIETVTDEIKSLLGGICGCFDEQFWTGCVTGSCFPCLKLMR